jgi:hypothetical protein
MLIEFNRPNYAKHLKVSNANRAKIASMTLKSSMYEEDNNREAN